MKNYIVARREYERVAAASASAASASAASAYAAAAYAAASAYAAAADAAYASVAAAAADAAASASAVNPFYEVRVLCGGYCAEYLAMREQLAARHYFPEDAA